MSEELTRNANMDENKENLCLLCNYKCEEGSLQCDYCKKWIHYKCTELPIYFLVFLENTKTKYCCIECIKGKCKKKPYEEQAAALEVEIANHFQDEEIGKLEDEKLLQNDIKNEKHTVSNCSKDCSGAQNVNVKVQNERVSKQTKSPEIGDGSHDSSALKKRICEHYRYGKCKYGLKGKGCDYRHPKLCRKFINDGNSQYGCTSKNSFFPPKNL